jgi:transposase
VVSALQWAEIRALASDGVSQREIAQRLGIHRRTVARALASDAPPRYVRAPAGSQLDPLMPVIERVLREWPEIKAPRLTELLRDEHGYLGSVDLVRRKLQSLRPPLERAAQRTGYRPGQVVQFDWGEMPTRPRIGGVERRVYALVASLPFSGAQSAHFSFDMTLEAFLEGHVRVFDWLGGVPRECVYDNLRSVVAKRDSRQVVRWNGRFLHLRGQAPAKAISRSRLGIKACQHGYRVAFATAQQWVSRLEEAQERNTLDQELKRLERYQLLIVDEVGYLPLERQAANLLFALVSRRYERGSVVITSNRGFEAWGEILGDAMVAAALIDRLVHHATMVTLKGKSYRLRERGTSPASAARPAPVQSDPPAQPAASHSARLRLAAREAAASLNRPSFQPAPGALFGS